MEEKMPTFKIVFVGAFATALIACNVATLHAAPLPTNVTAIKLMVAESSIQVRWRGDRWGYRGVGGWGYSGRGWRGAALAGAVIGGASASNAYDGGPHAGGYYPGYGYYPSYTVVPVPGYVSPYWSSYEYPVYGYPFRSWGYW
jgi:hypothetical protein